MLEVIADEIEEDINSIRPMYDIIVVNPGKDSEEIYNLLQNEK